MDPVKGQGLDWGWWGLPSGGWNRVVPRGDSSSPLCCRGRGFCRFKRKNSSLHQFNRFPV